jgi:predicted transcriptional regulator
MKNSTIPSLRVTPELRAAAESVLENGETLSSFVEHSLRLQIERRQSQREFIARGLASRDEAKCSGEYHDADDVLRELDELLDDAGAKAAK